VAEPQRSQRGGSCVVGNQGMGVGEQRVERLPGQGGVRLPGAARENDVRDVVIDPVRPSREEIALALAGFRGDILQRPCDYSAVHVDGKRAYRLARKGRPVELAAKPVRIDRLESTEYDWPRLGLDIECSSGTFVRAIGRDLAVALGTTAVMESLVRTAVGPFTIDASTSLDTLSPETTRAALLPPVAAVRHLPQTRLVGEELDRAIRGGLIECEASPAQAIVACDEAGDLVGILRRHESGRYRLKPNFRGLG
jgi:tRNA pseudouridine55 synthase